ncbi:hypothetical protein GUJ93_ZPchr0004g38858 [Zizania palustris]|uniref:Uncharacterized protein n=1 Tax=Zizania palustris TaxID=103762 RepID=A0A8J5S822_ZIZPA|nr:hypothetical protein GUJ93_ZPchr0004g38858 [Zizania palustris]
MRPSGRASAAAFGSDAAVAGFLVTMDRENLIDIHADPEEHEHLAAEDMKARLAGHDVVSHQVQQPQRQRWRGSMVPPPRPC